MTQDVSPALTRVYDLPLTAGAAIPWRYLAAAEHAAEWLDAAGAPIGPAAFGAAFTVAPDGDTAEGAGVLSLTAPAPAGAARIELRRATAIRQGWAAPPSAAAIEAQLDRTTLAVQEAAARAEALALPGGDLMAMFGRTLRAAGQLQEMVPAPGQYLAWNVTGDGLVAVPDVNGPIDPQAWRNVMGLGTASTKAIEFFATAAQGARADHAVLAPLGIATPLTDFDDVHTLGTGFYVGGGAAANNPDGTTITGVYVKANATDGQFIGFGALGGVNPPRMWVRRRAAGVWLAWESWAGYSQYSADLNAAVVPGAYGANVATLNRPGTADNWHVVVVASSPGTVVQLALQRAGPAIATRRYADGAWDGWVQAVTTASLLAELRAVFSSVPYVSSPQTITPGGLLTLPHGRGVVPSALTCNLQCQIAEHGWVVGDEPRAELSPSGATKVNSIWATATNVFVRFSDQAACFNGSNRTTGAAAVLTNANWRLIVRAWP